MAAKQHSRDADLGCERPAFKCWHSLYVSRMAECMKSKFSEQIDYNEYFSLRCIKIRYKHGLLTNL